MYQCHIYKHASDLYTWVIFINMGKIYKSDSLQKGGQGGCGTSSSAWGLQQL